MFFKKLVVVLCTVLTRKQWNRKTTFFQYLCVFDVAVKNKVLLETYQITYKVKYVCSHCSNAVAHAPHSNWYIQNHN